MTAPNAAILWPVRFSATTYVLRVTTTFGVGVTEDLDFPAAGTLTTGRNYWLAGDDQADADGGVGGVGDLVKMLEDTLNTNSNGRTFTVTISATNRISISVDADEFQLLWAHANTTLDELVFGWTAANAPDPPDSEATAPNQTQGAWCPEVPISEDSRDQQPIVGAVARAISGAQRASRLAVPKKERDITFELLPSAKILSEYGPTTEPYGALETAWVESISYGRPLRLYEDASVRTAASYTLYRTRDLESPIARAAAYKVKWDAALRLIRAD
jgi:hypothetical protein